MELLGCSVVVGLKGPVLAAGAVNGLEISDSTQLSTALSSRVWGPWGWYHSHACSPSNTESSASQAELLPFVGRLQQFQHDVDLTLVWVRAQLFGVSAQWLELWVSQGFSSPRLKEAPPCLAAVVYQMCGYHLVCSQTEDSATCTCWPSIKQVFSCGWLLSAEESLFFPATPVSLMKDISPRKRCFLR